MKINDKNKSVVGGTKKTENKAPVKKITPKKASISVAKSVGKSWRVQLASVPSVASAKKIYAKSLSRHSVLSGTKLFVETIKIKGKIYNRAQAVGFDTKAKAVRACKTIKKQGGQCLVKKP